MSGDFVPWVGAASWESRVGVGVAVVETRNVWSPLFDFYGQAVMSADTCISKLECLYFKPRNKYYSTTLDPLQRTGQHIGSSSLYLYLYSTLIKNIVVDDGVPPILQYRPPIYIRRIGRKLWQFCKKKYPHPSPHLQIRPSLVHPFLPQDKLCMQMHLDVPCNARASC